MFVPRNFNRAAVNYYDSTDMIQFERHDWAERE